MNNSALYDLSVVEGNRSSRIISGKLTKPFFLRSVIKSQLERRDGSGREGTKSNN